MLNLPSVYSICTRGMKGHNAGWFWRANRPPPIRRPAPGVETHLLKHDFFWSKAEEQPYGIQGSNHLLPGFGKVAKLLPTKMTLEKDKIYAWCACGYSNHQPFCDGNHNRREGCTLRPVRYIPDKDMEVWLCNCKQTKNRPFCDGSHKTAKEEEVFDAVIPKFKKKGK